MLQIKSHRLTNIQFSYNFWKFYLILVITNLFCSMLSIFGLRMFYVIFSSVFIENFEIDFLNQNLIFIELRLGLIEIEIMEKLLLQ